MQALIVANLESDELPQLTSSNTAAFLPLGSTTILFNLIKTFIDSDVSDIIITHNETQSTCFSNYIARYRNSWPIHLNIRLIEVPIKCSLSESLHRIKPRIVSDYLFLAYSTTVVYDLNLRNLFLTMVRNKASMVSVFSPLPKIDNKFSKTIPHELLLIEDKTDKILYYFPASNIKKQSKLSQKLLTGGRVISCRTDLRDVGFYLLSKPVLDHIVRSREDVSHRKKSVWQYLWADDFDGAVSSNIDDSSCDPDEIEKNLERLYYPADKPCGPCIYEHQDKILCSRLDSPSFYAEISRLISQRHPQDKHILENDVENSMNNLQLTDSNVHAKATIRGSVLGLNCVVGENCRIFNSVLLSNVTIKDNCHIQGCMIGEDVSIEAHCHLKNCSVAANQHVPSGTTIESEQLGFIDPELNGPQSLSLLN